MSNDCCNDFGQCTRGIGCPAGPASVAKVGKQCPRSDFVKSRMAEHHSQDQQEADDAISTVRMLGYALVALALTGAAVTLAVAITIFNQPN